MPEYDYFNGENFITFDLIEIDDEKREVTVAVSDTGRISLLSTTVAPLTFSPLNFTFSSVP